jgi:hypothetical protein
MRRRTVAVGVMRGGRIRCGLLPVWLRVRLGPVAAILGMGLAITTGIRIRRGAVVGVMHGWRHAMCRRSRAGIALLVVLLRYGRCGLRRGLDVVSAMTRRRRRRRRCGSIRRGDVLGRAIVLRDRGIRRCIAVLGQIWRVHSVPR